MTIQTNDKTAVAQPELSVPATSSGPTISFEEFIARPDDDAHIEWVDGRMVPMPAVGVLHGDVADFLQMLLRHWVESRKLGVVFSEPVLMKLGGDLPARSPDVMFLSNANLSRQKMTYIDGPADLVVEVISPGSGGRDRGEKFFEYEQGGVGEYWVIDADRKQAEFYQRGEDGIYHLVPPAPDEIYRSSVLAGLWLQVNWLWKRPPVMDVLRAWKLI
jgi:Uma2 family endonuclease